MQADVSPKQWRNEVYSLA